MSEAAESTGTEGRREKKLRGERREQKPNARRDPAGSPAPTSTPSRPVTWTRWWPAGSPAGSTTSPLSAACCSAPEEVRTFFTQTFDGHARLALRGARRRRGPQPGRRALARDRHVLRRAVRGRRAHRRADRARGHRPADGRGRQDPAQRRLLRQRPVRARDRSAAAAGQHDRAAHGGAHSTRAPACCGRCSSRTSSRSPTACGWCRAVSR